MNILFIYSQQDSQSTAKPLQRSEHIQFGISYISALLKKNGHRTKLIVLTRETRRKKLGECINNFYPALICFTSVYSEYRFISEIAQYIKERYPHIFLLAGGVHVSLRSEDGLSGPFDALCIGEGEYPTLELVEQLQRGVMPSGIPNLWIKHGDKVERNAVRPFLQNIDNLPFPDRKIWQEWTADCRGAYSVLLGRGCPFRCAYCCNHALKRLASGSYTRLRSSDNILKEIKEIVACYPKVKEIYLEVESIAINKDFAIELCSKLKDFNATLASPLSFGTNVRITSGIDVEEIFTALKNSNFKFINVGVESGSEKLRTQVLKRNYSNEDIVRVSGVARKCGLKVCFYNLIGIPGETIDDFKETVMINRACLPDWHFLSILFPYPGTDIYSSSRKKGLIPGRLDTEMERSRAILDLPGFSKKEIQKSYVWFDYYVYKGHKPLYKILARVFISKIKTNYYSNRLYRSLTNYAVLKRAREVLRRY